MRELHSTIFLSLFSLPSFLCIQSLILLLLHKLNGQLNCGKMMQGHVLVSTQVVLHDGECTQNCTSPYPGQILQAHWGFLTDNIICKCGELHPSPLVPHHALQKRGRTPAFCRRRFCISVGLNSSGTEHEHLQGVHECELSQHKSTNVPQLSLICKKHA